MNHFYRILFVCEDASYNEGNFKASEEVKAIDHAKHLLSLYSDIEVKLFVDKVYFGTGDEYDTVFECGSNNLRRS